MTGGDNVKGGDYRRVGRTALSAGTEYKVMFTSEVNMSTTYNMLWTRLAFSEGPADGFSVVCKAGGYMMFCGDGRKA